MVEPVLFTGDDAVKQMSSRLADPDFRAVIESVVMRHVHSQEQPNKSAKKADPFVFEIQNMLKAAQYHLDDLLSDEIALRLYTHARPHFIHARSMLPNDAARPDEQEALAVLDGVIRVADAARPVLFPKGIPSQDDPSYGSKPHGRNRKKPDGDSPANQTPPTR